MFLHRTPRFSPWVQALILVLMLVVMLGGCWLLVDAVATPDEVPRVQAFIGAAMFSLAAEPFGVLIALALSRKNDTG